MNKIKTWVLPLVLNKFNNCWILSFTGPYGYGSEWKLLRILGRIWVAGLVVVELLDLVLLMVMEWADKEDGLELGSYEAWMWLGGCRSGVQRGVWRLIRLPTCRCRIWVLFFFLFFSRIRADMALFTPNQANSARIKSHRLNRVISADDRNS